MKLQYGNDGKVIREINGASYKILSPTLVNLILENNNENSSPVIAEHIKALYDEIDYLRSILGTNENIGLDDDFNGGKKK